MSLSLSLSLAMTEQDITGLIETLKAIVTDIEAEAVASATDSATSPLA